MNLHHDLDTLARRGGINYYISSICCCIAAGLVSAQQSYPIIE